MSITPPERFAVEALAAATGASQLAITLLVILIAAIGFVEMAFQRRESDGSRQ